MPITAENLVRHELIGLAVRIAKSSDPGQKGLKGKVIDESYGTLRIEAGGKERIVPKANSTFVFTLPDKEKVQVEGKLLISRPEDRIKKRFAKW